MFNRRTFLQSAAAAAASGFIPAKSQVLKSVPKAVSLLGKVKIRDVQAASVMIRYPAHLVRIVTDQGVIGLGEAYNRAGIVDLIHDIKRVVIGEDGSAAAASPATSGIVTARSGVTRDRGWRRRPKPVRVGCVEESRALGLF